MPRPTLPIGIDSFGDLVRYRTPEGDLCLFIDKSMLINDFVRANEKVSLITRPRRFGKTLNLSMLQHFFAAKVGQEPTAGLFEGLKISSHPEIMAHQGKYPVIFLTLKAVRGSDFEKCLATFKEVVAELFKEHRYLLEAGNLNPEDETIFHSLLQGEADIKHYKISLRFLSQLLYAHHGKRVVMLLDEYDTPIHDAVAHGYFDTLKFFLAPMMNNAFKGNNALHRAMVTGILKVGQASFFSELNNVGVHTMLRPSRYGAYFGFTEQETGELLAQAGLTPQKGVLQQMYNGYAIGTVALYNPWSIICFMEGALELSPGMPIEEALRPYWINTGGTQLIGEMLGKNLKALQGDLQQLLEGRVLTISVNEEVVFNPHMPYDSMSFWSLMLLAGYLKVMGTAKNFRGDDVYQVTFPNEEVRRTMERVVLRVVTAARKIQLKVFISALEALTLGQVAPFRAFLEEYLQVAPSYHDTKGKHKEQFFHGLLLGITACLHPIYHVTSNREGGKGRYDIALEPKGKGRGIVMEFKVAGEGADLQAVAREAYQQVQERGYARALQQRGVADILVLGVAFSGEEVALVEG